MAPKQNQPITTKDLASNDKSPAVQAIYDHALKAVYRDQQNFLKNRKIIKISIAK